MIFFEKLYKSTTLKKLSQLGTKSNIVYLKMYMNVFHGPDIKIIHPFYYV